jgi:hypothetical protein
MQNVNHFSAQADVVVLGHNNEMADMDNPNGYEYGYASYVRAENPYGDTWVMHVATGRFESDVLAKALAQADALNARLALGKLPVGFGDGMTGGASRWTRGRPVYGSDAYQDYGMSDDWAWEMRLAEDTFAFGS